MSLMALADEVATYEPARPVALWVGLTTALLALLLSAGLGVAGKGARVAAHEGGHALVSFLMGRSRIGVRVFPGRGGVTESWGPESWFGLILVFLAGYAGPSLFGLLFVALVVGGRPDAVLVVTDVLMGLLLIVSRNLFTAAVAVGIGLLMFLTLRSGSGPQTFLAVTWTWFLLFAGVIDAVLFVGIRWVNRFNGAPDRGSDAYQLYEATWVPTIVWVALFVVADALALVYGARRLLGI